MAFHLRVLLLLVPVIKKCPRFRRVQLESCRLRQLFQLARLASARSYAQEGCKAVDELVLAHMRQRNAHPSPVLSKFLVGIAPREPPLLEKRVLETFQSARHGPHRVAPVLPSALPRREATCKQNVLATQYKLLLDLTAKTLDAE